MRLAVHYQGTDLANVGEGVIMLAAVIVSVCAVSPLAFRPDSYPQCTNCGSTSAFAGRYGSSRAQARGGVPPHSQRGQQTSASVSGHQRNVRHSYAEKADARSRWDRSYQSLLQWNETGLKDQASSPLLTHKNSNEHGDVRSGFNESSCCGESRESSAVTLPMMETGCR